MLLDRTYFDGEKSWMERLDASLERQNAESFSGANRRSITKCLEDPDTGLRMVVNIPADALLRFLEEGRYLNIYQEPVIGGKPRKPSENRRAVDSWLGFDDPSLYYFGAVAVGGTGVRFYGEYCMVLRRDRLTADTRIFDRNSYDLLGPPFDLLDDKDKQIIVSALSGTWGTDLVHMMVLKLLPALKDYNWLVTLGTISDMILHDEEFSEVHLRDEFDLADLEEIREAPEDETISAHILSQYERGILPTATQMLWSARRSLVARRLANEGVRTRVVASSGRGSRWK